MHLSLPIVYVAILSLYPMVVFPIVSGGLWICFVSLLEFSINLRLNCTSIVSGGGGRTGTIVACYYIYFKEMSADDALAEMRRRFATHGRSAWMSAPETEAQVNFIKEFANTYQQWK